MNTPASNRRTFLQQSLLSGAAIGLTCLAAPAPGRAATSKPRFQSIRLGGPAFAKTEDPEELALAHRKLGYRAAYCPKASLDDSRRIAALAAAFAKQGVVIAEVGRWVNLLDADAEKRRQNLEKVIEGLALADAIGALCCVDIAGSFSPDVWYGPHPDNCSPRFFDAAVENARKIIDAVKPKRARFAYEMMGWAIPESPDRYVKLLRAVDRKAFGVHLDPCNLVNSPERFYGNRALLNDCFDKLGRWIVSCHAKDLKWEVEMNVHFREVIPGTGALDYPTYLRRLAALPQQPPLMLEHLAKPEEYDEARRYVMASGEKAGLSFE